MNLPQAIHETVAFFALFDHPLTMTEIWRSLRMDRAVALHEVIQTCAENVWLKARLVERDGWVTLASHERAFALRRQRTFWTDRKFKKALKFVRWMSIVPFVRMIGIGNSVALNTTHEHSDIDFFVVAEAGHIWTVRFWLVSIAKLFRQRPQEHHGSASRPDALCFVYFVTTDGLNLEQTAIQPDDVYLAHWITQLKPLADADQWYTKFVQANAWATQKFPNWLPDQPVHWRQIQLSHFRSILQSVFEHLYTGAVGSWIEHAVRHWQWRILPEELRHPLKVDTGVMISEQCLKFHTHDQRQTFYDRWKSYVAS